MKKYGSGNLSRDKDIKNFSFSEEFDTSLIANRNEGVDALSEDDFVEKDFDSNNKKKKDKVISKDELAEIAAKSKEAKEATDLYNRLIDDEEENQSSIIKKEEIENRDDIQNLYDTNLIEEDLDKDEDETGESEELSDEPDSTPDEDYYYEDIDKEEFERIKHLLSEEELNRYKKKISKKKKIDPEQEKLKKILKKKEFERNMIKSLYSEDYEESDEYRDMIITKNKFNDIFSANKIEPKKGKSISSNLLHNNEIGNDKKKVDITHAPNLNNVHQTSTVEINRDENGEIENIVVTCKCGEQTLIKFDYLMDEDDNDWTVIEKDIENDIKESDNKINEDIDNSSEETQNKEINQEQEHKNEDTDETTDNPDALTEKEVEDMDFEDFDEESN